MEANKKKELIRVLKFTLFSISAGIIQIASFTLMNEVFKWVYWLSNVISIVLSVIWNFTFNRKFTFKATNNVPIAMLKVAAFYAVFTPLSGLAVNALTDAGVNEYIAQGLSMLVNFVTEFIYDKFVVFGKSTDTAEKKNSTENIQE